MGSACFGLRRARTPSGQTAQVAANVRTKEEEFPTRGWDRSLDETMEQQELMEAVKDGGSDALSQLYDIFERPVFSVALRTVRDRQLAEEAVQDTFLKVWRQARRYDCSRGSVSAWIFTIAKRTAIDVARRESRSPVPTETVSDEAAVPDDAGAVWTTWEVNLVLGSLPEEQRNAIDLFVIEGYTHAEVAERLDVPLGTVKTRIYSGLRRLRGSFGEHGLLEVDA